MSGMMAWREGAGSSSLRTRDPFFVLADFRAFVECQRRVAHAFRDPVGWTAASIRNTAAMSRFSTDRAVRQYASRVWHVQPVDVMRSDQP
jgi:glycogen phosphorylase